MKETTVKIIKRFIRCFSQSHDFLEHRFVIIPIKGVIKFYGNMFKRVYGSDMKCVTPFPYVLFKRKSEQPKRTFLAMNIMFCAKFKKTSSMPK